MNFATLFQTYKKHFIRLSIAVLLLFIFLKWAKIDDYSFIGAGFKSHFFWIGCFLLVFVQVVKTLRFQILISEYGVRVKFIRNFLIHLIVPIIGLITPSKLGEGMKLILIEDKKEKVGFCFILEKLNDMVILILIGTFGIIKYAIFFDSIYIFVGLLLIGVVALIFFDKIFNFLLQKMFKKKLEKNWFLNNLKLFFKPRHFFAFFLGIVIWVITIFSAFMFSKVIGLGFDNLSYLDFTPLYALSIIVGILSGLPGGIGSREATISLLFFKIFFIDIEIGASFSILNLFGNYLTFALIGLVSYLIFMFNNKKKSAIDRA